MNFELSNRTSATFCSNAHYCRANERQEVAAIRGDEREVKEESTLVDSVVLNSGRYTENKADVTALASLFVCNQCISVPLCILCVHL